MGTEEQQENPQAQFTNGEHEVQAEGSTSEQTDKSDPQRNAQTQVQNQMHKSQPQSHKQQTQLQQQTEVYQPQPQQHIQMSLQAHQRLPPIMIQQQHEQNDAYHLQAPTADHEEQHGERLSPRRSPGEHSRHSRKSLSDQQRHSRSSSEQRRQSRNSYSPNRDQDFHLFDLHQQQQNPSPTVLVVQQPIILGRGAYIRRGQPFMYRGVHLGNGTKIGMNCMLSLGTIGSTMIVVGAVYGFEKMQGYLLILIGAVIVISCLRLCYKAKHDYDALPQDHPDRVTYSSPIILTREAREIASSTTTYHLPPGAQIINSTAQGNQMAPTYQIPAGAQGMNSSTTHNSRSLPPAYPQQPGAVASSSSREYYEDKPPSYEEVCKNML
ncbi:hypothetical protein SK128_008237 [Halocaridina rubra]|uniref:Uncharacterized protein n=1 Tax=Halocaridina rubra TaxID=373956 RepID=A0AAN8WA60_HALRR